MLFRRMRIYCHQMTLKEHFLLKSGSWAWRCEAVTFYWRIRVNWDKITSCNLMLIPGNIPSSSLSQHLPSQPTVVRWCRVRPRSLITGPLRPSQGSSQSLEQLVKTKEGGVVTAQPPPPLGVNVCFGQMTRHWPF